MFGTEVGFAGLRWNRQEVSSKASRCVADRGSRQRMEEEGFEGSAGWERVVG